MQTGPFPFGCKKDNELDIRKDRKASPVIRAVWAMDVTLGNFT